jgi:hypothetical protein
MAQATAPVLDSTTKILKNRTGQAVIVQIREYKGRTIVDVRVHYTGRDGTLLPTRKGLSVAVLRLPELSAAVTKALATARELGLIDEAAS